MADNYSSDLLLQSNDKLDVSVVICTRNRGSSIVDTIKSIFTSDHPSFELMVIDQSTNNETRDALSPFLSDKRFCYIPSPTSGKGIACNIGLKNAKADIVVFTDDDCIVSNVYLSSFKKVFDTHPQVALSFCSVIPDHHNPAEGTIPQVCFNNDRILDAFTPFHLPVVMGAGIAMRRSVVTQCGGFDEMIGPGSLFKSGDDTDLVMRTLSNHHYIYQLSQKLVIHKGFRTNKDFRRTIANNFYGLGAIHAKYVKNFDVRIIPFILVNILVRCFWQPLIGSLKSKKIQGFGRLLYYIQGFLMGLKTPVDKIQLRYHSPN